MALARTARTFNPPQALSGGTSINIGGTGGPFGVFNLAPKTTNADLPYEHFGATSGTDPTLSAYDANVIVVSNPGRTSYLDLYHKYPGTTAPTTALVVKCYGVILGANRNVLTPSNAGIALPARFDPLLDEVIQLTDPVTGEHELTFAYTYPVLQSATTLPSNVTSIGGLAQTVKTFALSNRRSVYVAGVDAVIALVKTASNEATGGLVVGRFVS